MDIVSSFWCYSSSIASSKKIQFHFLINFIYFKVLNLIPMTGHSSKQDGRVVYELTSPVHLDTEVQSRSVMSLTRVQIL